MLPFAKYILSQNPFVKKNSHLQFILQGHVFFHQLNSFSQKISTSSHCERLSWERSTEQILLSKLKLALRNHQLQEALETFHDFRTLYGYPEVNLLNQFIVQLCYSSNHVWVRKSSDLALKIVEEKSCLLHVDTLTKLALSLARMQMPSPASVILRLMLNKGCVPSMHLLSLIVFHIVNTDIGTHLASNYLSQVCDFYNCLDDKKAHHAILLKPDTLVFNLVLDACVRFKLSLKGLCLIELMALTGIVADAHSIVIISQILEMNGLGDEMMELKCHIDGVSASYVRHYRLFYDSLLSLHFKFNDIDAAVKLVLDMNSSHNRHNNKEYKNHLQLQKPCFIAIGSSNLKDALKIHIEPELLQKDSVLKVEGREVLVFYRGGKLVLSNRALAKFIIGYKKDSRISELSKLLLSIQGEQYSVAGSSLCSDVISACIQMGWLESAHDILDDVAAAGSPMGCDTYTLLLSAYQKGGMQRESKALLKQMKKINLHKDLCNDAFDKNTLCEETSNSVGKSDLAVALAQISKDENQTVIPLVYNFNSSIFFFCKARMIEDALRAYRRMCEMKIQPTSQTFAHLVRGYSSLGMYREITFLWGDIKRLMKNNNFVVNRDLGELVLLNFIRGGYFERVMEVIGHMRDRNMYTDKSMYKSEFLRLHKNLYRSLKASDTRTEAQSKRLEHVKEFLKWAGIDEMSRK